MEHARLLAAYDQRLPRYTSYPTAAQFTPAVGAQDYALWLRGLPQDAPLSLYLHVPFCDQLCHYCGCNTSVVRREAPKLAYAEALAREIRLVAGLIGKRLPVSHIHWGGGTPTALPGAALARVMAVLREVFDVAADAEIAVELDPRHFSDEQADALAAIGLTRASLGVQDFAPKVQRAVGRVQSFETTWKALCAARNAGARGINLDLMYGLPHQTVASVTETARECLVLAPDRIAVFGYAHVPWMKRHQELLARHPMPDGPERLAQREAIDAVFRQAGYAPIGLDHYARPTDTLARAARHGVLHRNFQGYTTDGAHTLLGFGASAIGSLSQGYVQNVSDTPGYLAAIARGELASLRGVTLSRQDRLRRAAIMTLMCELRLDVEKIARAHNADPADLLQAAPALERMRQDGIIDWDGRNLAVHDTHRAFLRHVAAAFDLHLGHGAAGSDGDAPRRHARAI